MLSYTKKVFFNYTSTSLHVCIVKEKRSAFYLDHPNKEIHGSDLIKRRRRSARCRGWSVMKAIISRFPYSPFINPYNYFLFFTASYLPPAIHNIVCKPLVCLRLSASLPHSRMVDQLGPAAPPDAPRPSLLPGLAPPLLGPRSPTSPDDNVSLIITIRIIMTTITLTIVIIMMTMVIIIITKRSVVLGCPGGRTESVGGKKKKTEQKT